MDFEDDWVFVSASGDDGPPQCGCRSHHAHIPVSVSKGTARAAYADREAPTQIFQATYQDNSKATMDLPRLDNLSESLSHHLSKIERHELRPENHIRPNQALAVAVRAGSQRASLTDASLRLLADQVLSQSTGSEDSRRVLFDNELEMFPREHYDTSCRIARMCPGCAALLRHNVMQDEDETASEASEPSLATPAVVQQYFRTARMEFVMAERLDELDSAHRANAARTPNSEHLMSEANVYEDYYDRRRALVNDLSIIRQQLVTEREACLVEGTDPERFRYRRWS